MLVLTCKMGESVYIDPNTKEEILITIRRDLKNPGRIQLCFQASKDRLILREKLVKKGPLHEKADGASDTVV